MNNALAVTYKANDEELTVTSEDVRNVLGASTATDSEIRMFLELCKAQKLNPYIKEAYIVKYGNNKATLVVGKDVFTKRAQNNPRFEGMQAGITVITSNGELVRREGSMVLPGDVLVGGWCAVYVKGYTHPMKEEVSYQEYAGLKADGQPNKQWKSKPATMIRKVAIVHALREAFPDEFQGLYEEAEMGNLEQPEMNSIPSNVAEPQITVDEYEAQDDAAYGDYCAEQEVEYEVF